MPFHHRPKYDPPDQVARAGEYVYCGMLWVCALAIVFGVALLLLM